MSDKPVPPGRTPGSRITRSVPSAPPRTPNAPAAPKPEEAGDADHRSSTRSAALVESYAKDGGKDNSFRNIMIAAGALLVVGIILAIMSIGGNKEREATKTRLTEDATAAADEVRSAVTKLQDSDDYDTTIKQCKLVLDLAEKKLPVVNVDGYDVKTKQDLRRRITSAQNDMKERILTAEGKKKSLTTLKEAEEAVESADKIGSVALKLQSLKVAANAMSKEFQDRVIAIDGKLELNKLKFTLEKSRADAGTASDPENKLRAYEPAMEAFNAYFRKPTKPHDQAVVYFKEGVKEWDDLVAKLETPEYISNTPVRDLLAAKERQPGGVWGGTEGIRHEWSGRELVIEGVAVEKDGKERKLRGLFSIDGWSQKWTDLVLDIEFTIVAGEFDMMMRYRPDGYKPYTATYKAGEGGFNANEPYRMTVRVMGSTVEIEQADQPKSGDVLQPTVSRNGGIGFAVPKGSKIVISRCDLRVLRPRGGTR